LKAFFPCSSRGKTSRAIKQENVSGQDSPGLEEKDKARAGSCFSIKIRKKKIFEAEVQYSLSMTQKQKGG